MKRSLSILMVMVMMLALVAGCTSGEATTAAPAATTAAATTVAGETTTATAEKVTIGVSVGTSLRNVGSVKSKCSKNMLPTTTSN